MPKWGLTESQRQLRPWDLPPELLEPSKTTTDPVHGDVYLTVLERRLVDSRPMQRLRRVRQLGTSHLVYQGATHSRFSHSLGTLRAAQDLLDAVADNASGPRPPSRHLLAEWAEADRERMWAEATVLARLGGLLHDLCHVPYGHTIEDDLHVLKQHDGNAERFERLWAQLPDEARLPIEAAGELLLNLRRLILSKERRPDDAPPSAYPFVEDIVGNTICADLMDYLGRDHHATGLPMDVGVRFINDFYVAGSQEVLHKHRMVIKIDRNGHIRRDVIDEITKYLRFRYEESERVLFHHAKIAADAMIGKMLEMWRDSLWVAQARKRAPALASRHDDISDLKAAMIAERPKIAERIESSIRSEVETLFLESSDDGLLEHFVRLARASASDSRMAAVGRLADALLNRELYKPIGSAEGESAISNAQALHDAFGSADRRRELEMDAAHYAGVEPEWRVVMWLPSPSMRFKAADVLVDKRGTISRLANIMEGRDARRLVKKHEGLWSLAVFADAAVRDQESVVEEILLRLQEKTSIAFRTWGGRLIGRPEAVAERRFIEQRLVPIQHRWAIVPAFQATVAAQGRENTTFQDALSEVYERLDEAGFIVGSGVKPERI